MAKGNKMRGTTNVNKNRITLFCGTVITGSPDLIILRQDYL